MSKGSADGNVSVRDIAKAAGVSKSTVGYVLKNHPRVSPVTKARVLGIAKKMGYVPDARLVSWMTQVRSAAVKELLPIVWLNTEPERDAWHKHLFNSPYLEGARVRAAELGYRIDEIWTEEPGLSRKRLSHILFERGVEGLIVPPHTRHLQLNWDRLAAITVGNALLAPQLHRVTTDPYLNFRLALKMLKRYGYRRIGVCLDEAVNRYSNYAIGAVSWLEQSKATVANRVPPLYYSRGQRKEWEKPRKQICGWLKKYRPEVVISHNSLMVDCVVDAGFRVPEDIGVVHLSTDDDVIDWAGICANRRKVGAAAVEWVSAMIKNRQFGVPKVPMNIFIRGDWHGGKTLLSPHRGH